MGHLLELIYQVSKMFDSLTGEMEEIRKCMLGQRHTIKIEAPSLLLFRATRKAIDVHSNSYRLPIHHE